ncbi:MAG: hypothetical protein GTN93_04820, partial [Anaerolineae bacterium]|nr:hypothetical protein [Anaerolineae bacterium]
LVELHPEQRIGRGQAEYEQFWSIFIINGKPRLAFTGKDSPTCFLEKAGNGTWTGTWQIGERMPVRLVPVEATK